MAQRLFVFWSVLMIGVVLAGGVFFIRSPSSTTVFHRPPVANEWSPGVNFRPVTLKARKAVRSTQTLQRPLFSPTRRMQGVYPPVIKKKKTARPKPLVQPKPKRKIVKLRPKPKPTTKGMAILGVQQSDVTIKVLLKPRTSQLGKWFAVGERVDGWVIKKITEDAVLLQQGKHLNRLHLYLMPKQQ